MYIAVTGYFGSGSSAALDLLSEYSCNGTGIVNELGGYEHTTFYHPGGLFDLEDKLLKNNDIHRSDEAIKTFRREMLRLNDNNFGWYGSFNEMFGDTFKENMYSFIDALHPFDINTRYYGQCSRVRFNPFKIPVQLAAKILTGRTIYKWGRQFIYDSIRPGMHVAFPSEEEFYSAAKRFVKSYMQMFESPEKENTLFDRLLLCHNIYRLPYYFDQDFRVIRLQRDVRDVYILNKYIWKEINAGVMFPCDLTSFIDYWKRLNSCERKIEDDRVLVVDFEDLIYKYEETVDKIEKHCNLNNAAHTDCKKYFEPNRSIKNTQVFRMNGVWHDEIAVLEKEFPEYIYDFPYKITTDVNDMFDDSRSVKKRGIISLLRHK